MTDRPANPTFTLPLAAGVALLVVLMWSYWPTLAELWTLWQRNQDYSVGQLVPLAALFLVWRERGALTAAPVRPCWWGLLVLLAAEGMRQFGIYYGIASGARYALVVSIAGVVLLAAGWRVFWRLKWILLFLFLMIPLPARVHEVVALPLQRASIASGVFVLELLGYFVTREGNVIRLGSGALVAVNEACGGLRMLTAFIVVTAVLAFLIERPAWQRVVLLACSLPIAVVCNMLRVVTISLFVYYYEDPDLADRVHDMAGLAMMPAAIAFGLLVLKILALLTQPAGAGANAPAARRRAAAH
jgi:exosortase